MCDFLHRLALLLATAQPRVPRHASRAATVVALLAAGLVPVAAIAQSVRWDPPGGQLGYNQVSQLSLVFENCEPDGDPKLPTIDGLQVVGRPSQSSQTSIVNFKMSQTFSLIYPMRPTKRAPIVIPTFEIKTDKGVVKVPAARFSVGDAPVGNSGLSVEDIASATLEVPEASIWAGEVFPVTYTLDVVRRYFHSLGSYVQWPATPAVADDWSKPDPTETVLRGERRVVSTQTARAVIKEPGTYTLKPASQMVNIMVGSTGFGLFSQPNVEQRQIDSRPLNLTVRPLPPAPPEFRGAVGTFSFVSKVIPVTAAVGEPITWTLELAGTGNWPDITGLPQREVSNDFQVVQPKSKRTMKEGTLFEGTLTEDVVLVPSRAGTYQLAPVRFSYFDPKSGTYQTITTEPVTLTIGDAPAPAVPPATGNAPLQFSLTPPAAPAATPAPTAAPPVPPENLPREPIADVSTGVVPKSVSWVAWTSGVIGAGVPLVAWLVLAGLRSKVRDPQLRRREAHAALGRILAELRARDATDPAVRDLVGKWQHQAIALWKIPHAAPGVPLLRTSLAQLHPDGLTDWSQLWQEADRALHGRDAFLPDDWIARAQRALQSARVPAWNPLSLFGPRNLLPFLAALTVVLLLPAALRAETSAEAYRRGDFAAAHAGWTRELAAAPTSWTTRHNLGLALAQQDRWAEATAHWTSAALLRARSDAVRWELSLGLQRSGLGPTELVDLSRGTGAFRLARIATPGEWQLLVVAASVLFAGALILLLLQSFARIGRWGSPIALIAMLVAVLLAAAATFSLRTYGPLANPSAVFVWEATTLRSVPTEADTAQKTSPLSAGSIAVAEKTFLGWTKLVFPAGQSGWVRTDAVVRLYR